MFVFNNVLPSQPIQQLKIKVLVPDQHRCIKCIENLRLLRESQCHSIMHRTKTCRRLQAKLKRAFTTVLFSYTYTNPNKKPNTTNMLPSCNISKLFLTTVQPNTKTKLQPCVTFEIRTSLKHVNILSFNIYSCQPLTFLKPI